MRRVSCITSLTAVSEQHRDFSLKFRKSAVDMGRIEPTEKLQEAMLAQGRAVDGTMKQYRSTFWRVDEYMRRIQHEVKKRDFFYLPVIDFNWHTGCNPLFSAYQIRVHYKRHHQAYIDKLNKLIVGTPFYGCNLDEIIMKTAHDPSYVGIFNNAAQHYNHCFFWKSIAGPLGTNIPPDLQAKIEEQYGSMAIFKKQFSDAAMNLFGSGWVYFVYDAELKKFDILSLPNAGCPLAHSGITPMMCIDVWEHAYYIDYENSRANFVEKYWECCDWDWAERHWKLATGQEYIEMKGH